MKFKAENYISPKYNQGKFENVFVEDTCITHKRNDKYLSVEFEMYCLIGNERFVLDTQKMIFYGMEDDETSTNRTTFVRVANPDYNEEDENSEEFLIVPLFDSQGNQNYPSEEILAIEDYGYPTYEKAINMFQGGTFSSPEIIPNDPLAIGFILNTLCLNGQLIKEQFEILINE